MFYGTLNEAVLQIGTMLWFSLSLSLLRLYQWASDSNNCLLRTRISNEMVWRENGKHRTCLFLFCLLFRFSYVSHTFCLSHIAVRSNQKRRLYIDASMLFAVLRVVLHWPVALPYRNEVMNTTTHKNHMIALTKCYMLYALRCFRFSYTLYGNSLFRFIAPILLHSYLRFHSFCFHTCCTCTLSFE